LASEDMELWCRGLSASELEERPLGLPSVGFHMRHMVRSLDRLLTYAEGQQLNEEQLASMKSEMEGGGQREDLFAEFERGIESAMERVRAIGPAGYEEARGVGRKMLPTSVGGLLVHCADHTQRHVGQAVTTAKVVRQAEE
ncbi:MAG TPA: DinB family protein, partial [Edaphobacter sp.]|nr:DinB family protein [Edaphobacter sp.]